MKISCIQMDMKLSAPDENFSRAAALIESACADGCAYGSTDAGTLTAAYKSADAGTHACTGTAANQSAFAGVGH